jgi:hypothetical protein
MAGGRAGKKFQNYGVTADEIGLTTLSTTAGILYTVTQQPLREATPLKGAVTLGQTVSYYVILKGVLTFLEGIIYLADAKKNEKQPTKDDLLMVAGGLLTAWTLLIPGSCWFSFSSLVGSNPPLTLLIWMIQGLFIVNLGKNVLLSSSPNLSSTEMYARGVIQLILGTSLIEGAFESIFNVNPLGLPQHLAGFSGILYRLMFSAWYEFFTAVHDFSLLFNHQDFSSSNETKATAHGKLLNAAFLNALKKGCEAGGWTLLATFGFSNPLGWTFIAGSLLICAYKHCKLSDCRGNTVLFNHPPHAADAPVVPVARTTASQPPPPNNPLRTNHRLSRLGAGESPSGVI